MDSRVRTSLRKIPWLMICSEWGGKVRFHPDTARSELRLLRQGGIP